MMLNQKSIIGAIRTPVINGKLVLGGKFPTAIRKWMNNEFGTIRTLIMDNEVWFVGKDVAKCLGYAKTRNAIYAHVESDDKRDALIRGVLGGTQRMIIINEPGMYSLVFSSELPNKKLFKYWVTHEVLPSILDILPIAKARGF